MTYENDYSIPEEVLEQTCSDGSSGYTYQTETGTLPQPCTPRGKIASS